MRHLESFPGRVVLSFNLIRNWRDSSHRMSHIKWGGTAQGAMRPIQTVVVVLLGSPHLQVRRRGEAVPVQNSSRSISFL
ncbi:MAG: hypothetical protein CAF41_012800 [Nitrospira sp. CG24A]|nr:MAG: hypothetical protein CAF41_012800 [Nitrospira sp. CG24A]